MKRLLSRLAAFGSALALSLSSLFIIAVPSVSAVSVLWDGGGSDNNFSTPENWSSDIVPSDGDDLVFRNDAITASETYTNDLTNFAPRSFSFQLNGGTNYWDITIDGNPITITNGIYTDIGAQLDLDLTLNGDQTFTSAGTSGSLTIGSSTATRSFSIGSSNLTIDNDSSCGTTRIDANMSGSGQFNVTGDTNFTVLSKSNSTYTGAITVASGSNLQAQDSQSLGTVGVGTTIASGGTISLASSYSNGSWGDKTYAEPITISGSGGPYNGAIIADVPYFGTGCKGGIPDVNFTITLSGQITLLTDVTVSSWVDGNTRLKVTGQIVGSHKLTVESGSNLILEIASSNNGSSTPNGNVEATPETVAVAEGDSQPSTSLSIGKNQTYVVNGERGDVAVRTGGILKGTGTVGALTVSSGGTVAPGESPGCLTAGNTTLNGNFDVELGGTTVCTEYDQLQVTGTVDVTGATLNASFWNGYVPTAGNAFTIISNDASDAITGTFTGLAEGATVAVNGVNFTISYLGGDGNDVVLTVASVPTAPNTGFATIMTQPLTALFITTAAAGLILNINRRYIKTKKGDN